MNDKLTKLWNSPKRTPSLVGLVAFTAGLGLGYLLAKRSMKAEVSELADELDKSSEEKFKELRNGLKRQRGTYVIPAMGKDKPVIVNDADLATFITSEFIEPTLSPEPVELVTKSIFDDKTWDYQKEILSRSKDKPYILHKDEFYAEEYDYTQTTLTYYAGDNIMVDQEDSPIYNHETITGPLKFGHGSPTDPNVVHVRNDKLKAEYEILFDPGLYSVEILGLEIENNTRVQDLKHGRNMKFRDD